MAIPTNLTQALALLTAVGGERISALDLREVVTWLSTGATVQATTAALTALDDASLVEGTLIPVASVQDFYRLDKTSTVALQEAVVVATQSGTGRWIRQGLSSVLWRNQETWFIDAVDGDDENDGATEETAIRTQAEWVRRVGTKPLVHMELTFLNDTDEWMLWDLDSAYEQGVLVKGIPSAPIFTGTMTSVQTWSSAANQDGRFTEAGLPVSWTASGYVGAYAKMTSGDANGLVFWIAKDLGTKQCRYSYIVDMDLFEVVHPAEGDTYTLHTLTKLTGQHLFQPRGHSGQFLFQDLEIGAPENGSHQNLVIQGNPIFLRCKVHGCDIQNSGQSDAWQCWWQNGSQARIYENGRLLTFGGVVPSGMLIHSGEYRPELTLLQGVITLESPRSLLRLNSSTAVFNDGQGALLMTTMSQADLSWGRFFGAVQGTAIQMGSGCRVVYDFLPTITSATNLSFGGTTKTYAELPYVDTATQSYAVAWTE